MKNCLSCNTTLLPDALFCHGCGKQSDGDGVVCFECNNLNPKGARFCSRCGTPINIQYTPKPNISPIYGLDFNDIPTLPTQLSEAFKVSISLALETENNIEKEALFLQTFDKGDFKQQYLEEITVLMTQEFEDIFEERGISAFKVIETEIEKQFAALLERFFIDFCNPLLPHQLTKQILQYQEASFLTTNLHRMINDYLHLEEEALISYSSAIDIPLKKLKNARSTFFKPKAGEIPYVFIDHTLLRSGKEGCIVTAKAIYWKAYFQKSARIEFSTIQKLTYYKDRVEINDIYLNINPSINYKIYRLLARLKSMLL
jgi:ribosomal protein L40E